MATRFGVRAGRAFDGERAVAGGALVLVEDERIVGVEPGGAPAPDGWDVHAFPSGTVLPGLVDAHVHLCGDGVDAALERLDTISDADLARIVEDSLLVQLTAGVTTVRDLGDRRFAVVDAKDAEPLNGAARPRVLAAGPPLTSARGHCWNMGGEVTGDEALRRAVAERAQRGADVVKVMMSGGFATPGTDVMSCQFELDELRLVVDAAHAAGLPVTAHAHGLPAVLRAVEAGVDGIEHGTCVTPDGVRLSDAELERLAASRAVVCPTFGFAGGLVPPPEVVALFAERGVDLVAMATARFELMRRMHEAGVRHVAGSDGGVATAKPHGLLAQSLTETVLAGVPSDAALASATSVAAGVLGLGDRTGRLRPGLDADVLVVDGDPLADVAALGQVCAVWARGRRAP